MSSMKTKGPKTALRHSRANLNIGRCSSIDNHFLLSTGEVTVQPGYAARVQTMRSRSSLCDTLSNALLRSKNIEHTSQLAPTSRESQSRELPLWICLVQTPTDSQKEDNYVIRWLKMHW